MVNEITANDLKVKGITAIEDITGSGYEAVITVRGKQKTGYPVYSGISETLLALIFVPEAISAQYTGSTSRAC